ncbi:MAG: tRNA (adenosine(37)-N6)-threonylcarbamoyltransferase complex dimerization subunit type 1 TsaB [Chloroflexi bacterium]|nr:tRNA (adenosine(37)-N6)-threonylcarbamoyltransferase complex dimerization subunit type 1 TsaB [Chloroflexota bacterium]
MTTEEVPGGTGALAQSSLRPDVINPRSFVTPQASVLLAIDTCTKRSSVALRDATTLRAESSWESDRHHTAAVSERIRTLMNACGVKPEEIGAVAVAIGPGSFTGVRCGLAIAKGIAIARAVPLIGVSAFEVVAAAQPNRNMPIYALVEAGRSRVAACRFEWVDASADASADVPASPETAGAMMVPAVAGEWAVRSWKDFADSIEPPVWVCGDLAPALIALLQTKATLAPAPLNLRRAGYLAEIGYTRWLNGETDDVMTLMPIYPGES